MCWETRDKKWTWSAVEPSSHVTNRPMWRLLHMRPCNDQMWQPDITVLVVKPHLLCLGWRPKGWHWVWIRFEGFFKYERVWSFGADGHHGRSVCFLLMSLKTEDGPGVSLRTAQGTSPLVWSTEEFVACDVRVKWCKKVCKEILAWFATYRNEILVKSVRGLLAHAVSKIACVPLAVACD